MIPRADRTQVMGIVNVTPDSFSDGGDHADTDSAVRHGLALLDQGADILDVGGESTRPGSTRPSEAEELARVVPVVAELSARGAIVSVDTMRASVAAASAEAGARIINDVSGGLADPGMHAAVAGTDLAYVVMHWRGHGDRMHERAHYTDVVAEVRDEVATQVDRALAAGIGPERLIIDPGIGFATTRVHDWELLRHVDEFAALGYPVLIGASRKRFLGDLLAHDGDPRPPKSRDAATAAVTAWIAQRHIWAVRTHEVRAQRDVIAVMHALTGEGEPFPTPEAGAAALMAVFPPGLDRITLTGIVATGYHGVFPHEKRDGQKFGVDVTLGLDLSDAASTDDLAATVDYGVVAQQVCEVIEGEPYDLIESLAQRIADTCLDHDRVEAVDVTVHKPQAPIAVPFTDTTVRITRTR